MWINYHGNEEEGEDLPLVPSFNRHWARHFQKKYASDLSFQIPRTMEPVRCTVDAADIREFYEELSLDVVAFNIDPRLMANFDETMLKAIDRVLKVYFPSELPRPTIPKIPSMW